MAINSNEKIKAMVAKEMLDVHNRFMDVKKSINDSMESTIEYLHTLLAQIPESVSGPLIAKTPKISRKKGVQRIETIPEDDVVFIDSRISDDTFNIKAEIRDSSLEVTRGRSKRKASEKAASNIRKQQSMSLATKLRRPSSIDREDESIKTTRTSRTKRKINVRSSSDEESQGPTKHSKTEESILRDTTPRIVTEEQVDNNNRTLTEEVMMEEEQNKPPTKTSLTSKPNRKRTLSNKKKSNSDVMNDTVIAPSTNGLDDRSLYEDAIEKTMPIMNSTMNLNTTHVINKMMNVTVVIEPLPMARMNETVTLNECKINDTQKLSQTRESKSQSESKSPRTSKVQSQPEFKSPEPMVRRTRSSSKPLQDRMQELKEAMANKEFDDLITEDESSPEIKKHRPLLKKQEIRKRQKRIMKSVTSSEDEIFNTPAKPTLKEVNSGMTLQEIRNTYKSNALFSPYAKESVKKRVEAFEHAGGLSPKPAIDINAPARLTRTKTRALAAAQEDGPNITKPTDKSVAQKLARKSLAKAKRISLVKQAKEMEEYKENKVQSVKKMQRLAEKGTLPSQQKITPLRKTKIQLPTSVSRIPQTPSNYPITHNTKPLSAMRTNIITSVDSFIQTAKPTNKRNSLDKLEEKKRKMNDEDARKKREETLRLQTEEKRRKRQEKELKNKLAREAKEKLEVEKRQRAEKDREEKARLAQQMQEKQREELEKKRMAQLQRAQEKEERRRLEEQQRLQRLQEQEEAERILAEQRRREQEAEKRKELEVRAQQHTHAEAVRIKNQLLQAQAKYANKYHQGPTNYVLDSEPDEDGSDNESNPKHAIPYWAQPQVRRGQLLMQRYIPTKSVLRFFDSRKCTPDLTELFQGIDRSRLKRTSSAIWKTPPRYSMMMDE
ncbi:inner centromere protein [Lasioglossum baleicum]|uniref:inner centromere protein n=1 Tax=Lasioglossum baleicum TaxID=434251 RepID=UPI003FCE1DC7